MRRFCRVVLVGFALVTFSLRGQASTVGPSNSVYLCNAPPGLPGVPCPSALPGTTLNTPGPVSFTTPQTGGPDVAGNQFVVVPNFNADSTGNVLRASAAYTSTDLVTGQPASVPIPGFWAADAQFNDQVTVFAPGIANGTTGYLQPGYAVTANLQGAGASASLDISGSFALQSQALASGMTFVQFNPVPITFGVPFYFSGELLAPLQYGPGFSGGLSNDTAVLNLLGVYTDLGLTNPVSDAQFTSAEGLTYTNQGLFVSEPVSIAYMLVGLCLVFATRARAVFRIVRHDVVEKP